MTVRIATRGSRLATTQSNWVADQLRLHHPGLKVELVILQTTGDRILDTSLAQIGGKGVFTKEVENALLDGRADIAVHSLKDLPTQQPAGLWVSAIPPREMANDVLISVREAGLGDLAKGEIVGTSSLRRRAQLLNRCPGLVIEDLRGNVPTRVKKVQDGQYAAIVLAAAGVNRLGISVPHRRVLQFDEMLPAPGQGALALQTREEDAATRELLEPLEDRLTRACTSAERALLEELGGGCQLPLGAIALPAGSAGTRITLRGRVLALDGSRTVEGEIAGDAPSAQEAERLGRDLAEQLLAQGADEILANLVVDSEAGYQRAVERSRELDDRPLGGTKVIVTRDEDTDGPLSMALRELGAHPIVFPLVQHTPGDTGALRRALSQLAEYDWLILTSARAVHALQQAGWGTGSSGEDLKIACVGSGTESALRALGRKADLVPGDASAQGLIRAFRDLPLREGAEVLYPKADRAKRTLTDGLLHLGAAVNEVIAYTTSEAAGMRPMLEWMEKSKPDAVLFCSASAAEALREIGDGDAIGEVFSDVTIGSMGPTTTEALRNLKLNVDFEAADRSFPGLARALADFRGKQHGGSPK